MIEKSPGPLLESLDSLPANIPSAAVEYELAFGYLMESG